MQWLYTSLEPSFSILGFCLKIFSEAARQNVEAYISHICTIAQSMLGGRPGDVAVGLGMRLEWCSGIVALGLDKDDVKQKM